jgi:hypothetical protein
VAGTNWGTVVVRGALGAWFEKFPKERQAVDLPYVAIQTWF